MTDPGVGGGEFEVAANAALAHAASADDPHELDRPVVARVWEGPTAASVRGPFVERCQGWFIDGDAAFGVEFADRDDEILRVTYKSEPEVRAFSTEDVAAMLDAAATPPPTATSAWAARDVAVIDVLASAGVRAAELCGLQVGDVGTTDRPLLHIRRNAKGNRRREIPLPRHSTDRLDRYLAERADRGLRMGRAPSCSSAPTARRCPPMRCTTS